MYVVSILLNPRMVRRNQLSESGEPIAELASTLSGNAPSIRVIRMINCSRLSMMSEFP